MTTCFVVFALFVDVNKCLLSKLGVPRVQVKFNVEFEYDVGSVGSNRGSALRGTTLYLYLEFGCVARDFGELRQVLQISNLRAILGNQVFWVSLI